MLKPKTRLTKRKIKEDKLVTTYFKAVEFFQQYQNYILGGLGAIIIIIFLAIYINQSRTERELQASGHLAAARQELANYNTDAAIDSLNRLVTLYEGSHSAGLGCFYLANAYFMKNEIESAQQYFQTYLDSYDDNPMISASATAGLAACLEEKKEYQKAAEKYEKVVEKYPKVFNHAEHLLSAARCYRLAGSSEKARQLYQRIIDEYPNSGFKNDAEIYLAQLQA